MSPIEAKMIIHALANGIDPETGEVLPTESTFNNPQVIRALFIATMALDTATKHFERPQKLPKNAGAIWSDKESEELLAHFDSGMPIKEIAQKHGRTEGGIASRLVRLGRIKERAEAYREVVHV